MSSFSQHTKAKPHTRDMAGDTSSTLESTNHSAAHDSIVLQRAEVSGERKLRIENAALIEGLRTLNEHVARMEADRQSWLVATNSGDSEEDQVVSRTGSAYFAFAQGKVTSMSDSLVQFSPISKPRNQFSGRGDMRTRRVQEQLLTLKVFMLMQRYSRMRSSRYRAVQKIQKLWCSRRVRAAFNQWRYLKTRCKRQRGLGSRSLYSTVLAITCELILDVQVPLIDLKHEIIFKQDVQTDLLRAIRSMEGEMPSRRLEIHVDLVTVSKWTKVQVTYKRCRQHASNCNLTTLVERIQAQIGSSESQLRKGIRTAAVLRHSPIKFHYQPIILHEYKLLHRMFTSWKSAAKEAAERKFVLDLHAESSQRNILRLYFRVFRKGLQLNRRQTLKECLLSYMRSRSLQRRTFEAIMDLHIRMKSTTIFFQTTLRRMVRFFYKDSLHCKFERWRKCARSLRISKSATQKWQFDFRSKVFFSWTEHMKQCKKLWQMVKVSMRNMKILVVCNWFEWVKNIRQRRNDKKRYRKDEILRLFSFVFGRWHAATKRLRHLRRVATFFSLQDTDVQSPLPLALRAWKKSVSETRKKRKLVKVLCRTMFFKAFLTWRCIARNKVRIVRKLSHAMKKRKDYVCLSTLAQWQERNQQSKMQKRKMLTAVRRWSLAALSGSWLTWSSKASEKKGVQCMTANGSRKYIYRTIYTAWKRWLTHVMDCKKLRQLESTLSVIVDIEIEARQRAEEELERVRVYAEKKLASIKTNHTFQVSGLLAQLDSLQQSLLEAVTHAKKLERIGKDLADKYSAGLEAYAEEQAKCSKLEDSLGKKHRELERNNECLYQEKMQLVVVLEEKIKLEREHEKAKNDGEELQARVHHLRTRSSLYEDELTEAYELLELLRTALHDVSSSHEAAVAAAVADTKEAVVLAQERAYSEQLQVVKEKVVCGLLAPRIARSYFAAVFYFFADALRVRKARRRTCRKILNRKMREQLSSAFERYCEGVSLGRHRRRMLAELAEEKGRRDEEESAARKRRGTMCSHMANNAMRRWQKQAMSHAWGCWYEQHVKLARLRNAGARALKRWTQRAIAAAWLTWCKLRATSKRHASKMLKIASRCNDMHYARAFGRWRQVNATSMQNASKMFKIVSRWNNRHYAKAFATWQEHIEAVRKRCVAATKVVKRWTNKALVSSWNKWWGEVRRSRVARRVALKWRQRTLCAAWKTWEARVQELRRQKGVLDKMSLRRKRAGMSMGWMRWDEQWRHGKDIRRASQKVVGMCRCLLLVAAFGALKEAAVEVKVKRGQDQIFVLTQTIATLSSISYGNANGSYEPLAESFDKHSRVRTSR